MPIPDQVTDHLERGRALLIELFRNGKPVLDGLLAAHLAQLQLLENAIWDVLIQRLLANAVGYHLDAIGRIVGAFRDGASDADFKAVIQLQIRVNRSFGTTADIYDIIQLITDLPFVYAEEAHCTAHVTMSLVPEPIAKALSKSLRAAKKAGYRILFEYTTDTVPVNTVFRWSDDSGANGQGGFGSVTDPTAGGILTSIQE